MMKKSDPMGRVTVKTVKRTLIQQNITSKDGAVVEATQLPTLVSTDRQVVKRDTIDTTAKNSTNTEVEGGLRKDPKILPGTNSDVADDHHRNRFLRCCCGSDLNSFLSKSLS